MGFKTYRDKVLACIEKKIGGKPAFSLDEYDEMGIHDSYGKGHSVSVVAACLIEAKLEEAQSEETR